MSWDHAILSFIYIISYLTKLLCRAWTSSILRGGSNHQFQEIWSRFHFTTMECLVRKGDVYKRTLLSILYSLLLYKGVFGLISWVVVSTKSFLGVVCSPSELGNIWRDEPNVGAFPSHDWCGEGLGQVKTMQNQELPWRCKECSVFGHLPWLLFLWVKPHHLDHHNEVRFGIQNELISR